MNASHEKPRTPTKRPRIVIAVCIVLAAVLVVSVVMLARDLMDYAHGRSTYTEAEKIANIELPTESESTSASSEATASSGDSSAADPYAAALESVDLDALREVNDEVLGWIYVPDTSISYPLVYSGDNSYYLTRTWNLEYSSVGSIFLDELNNTDFSDYNTIIYGHRMKDGSMFAGLKYYKTQDYYEQHPCVYIATDEGVVCYQIFAAYEAGTESATYTLSFDSDSDKQSFIDHCVSKSVISTGVTPTVSDKIITLSTCTGNGYATRWVVQAAAVENND